MDAHSGGMSGSTSNSKLVKKALGSSIRRPVVHSGPLEHQLAPAIQQGNYRHAPLDRTANSLDHLLRTNDQADSRSSSSSLVDNINHHLALRTLKINHPHDSHRPTYSHNRIIGAGIAFAFTILLSICICTWILHSHRRDREAQTADTEAAKVVDEVLPAPKEDGEHANANANANPVADPDAGFVSRLWRRSVFARNPFHDRHAAAAAIVPYTPSTPVKTESAPEAEASEFFEKHNDGYGCSGCTAASRGSLSDNRTFRHPCFS